MEVKSLVIPAKQTKEIFKETEKMKRTAPPEHCLCMSPIGLVSVSTEGIFL